MHPLRNFAFLVARILIAGIFVYDALLLVQSWDNSLAFIGGIGLPHAVPTKFYVAAIVLCEIVGSIMIVFGFWTRFAALCFAAFCVATAVMFHRDFSSVPESIQFGKDLAIAGGFLFLAGTGPGGWALDRGGRGAL